MSADIFRPTGYVKIPERHSRRGTFNHVVNEDHSGSLWKGCSSEPKTWKASRIEYPGMGKVRWVMTFSNERNGIARIIRRSRGVSLGIRHHNAFAFLTNTDSFRSVAENTLITKTVAILLLRGELSRPKSDRAARNPQRAKTSSRHMWCEDFTQQKTAAIIIMAFAVELSSQNTTILAVTIQDEQRAG